MTISDGRLRLSLRDYFAGQALIAIAGRWGGTVGDIDVSGRDLSATVAYQMADAMLRARKTPPEA